MLKKEAIKLVHDKNMQMRGQGVGKIEKVKKKTTKKKINQISLISLLKKKISTLALPY